MSGRLKGLTGLPGPGGVLRLLVCVAAVLIATLLWFEGLFHSPLMDPRRQTERKFVSNYVRANTPDSEKERLLADSYWRRYRDVREDAYWGENGPMGIWGPRDHYRQHGRKEGRIFRPVTEAPDPEAEKTLARAYWDRYPNVRGSPIWGENSDLGILGPRDHFIHIGRFLGLTWGPPAPPADGK
ncbi:MAG: hypothetical protein A2X81_12765 [Desulfobacterales bacterium GWB2_56_26]|nr:MAG: hypothetical protein A2X81_12765 [Desulfobacterales bacterium GWB2_56_26]